MIVTMNETQLIELNAKGLIPGPEESEEQFLKRAAYCQSLNASIAEELQEEIPFTAEKDHPACMREGLERAKKLYGIAPDWVPIFFSNHQLMPWHGGCAWIFQKDVSSPTSAFLQLKKSLKNRKRFLGIYERSELIAHELCHVGRMSFNEPRFEEILACNASTSPFRRWLGPIVQSTWESLVFVGLLMVIFLMDLYLVFLGYTEAYYNLMWLKSVPLIFVGMGILRLFIRHRQLRRCRQQLSWLDAPTADQLLFRLTDKEIRQIGKMQKKEITELFKNLSTHSVRGKLIWSLYFQNKD